MCRFISIILSLGCSFAPAYLVAQSAAKTQDDLGSKSSATSEGKDSAGYAALAAPIIEKFRGETTAEHVELQDELFRAATNSYPSSIRFLLKAYKSEKNIEARVQVQRVIERLVVYERFDRPRGYIGITVNKSVFTDAKGVDYGCIIAAKVYPDSGAEAAGMLDGDMITSINDFQIKLSTDQKDFIAYVQTHRPGDSLELGVVRADGFRNLQLTLTGRPIKMAGVVSSFNRDPARDAFLSSWLEARKMPVLPEIPTRMDKLTFP